VEGTLAVPGKENLGGAVAESLDGSRIDFCQRLGIWPTAFVAETYGRLTGQPGVCISALGPGVQSFCFISRVCLQRAV
jgi:acetolactate synthase I/II/III large subunit